MTIQLIKNLKLGTKLSGICVALVVIPLLLIGAQGLRSQLSLGRQVTGLTGARLQKDAEAALLAGAKRDGEQVTGFVKNIENEARQLAGSGTVMSYLEAVTGRSEVWTIATRQACDAILDGIDGSAAIQHAASVQTLKAAMALSVELMHQKGAFSETERKIEWSAINQVTKQRSTATLPQVQLGDLAMAPNEDPGTPTPLIDDMAAKSGAAATLFQRMNESGDMLRTATSVVNETGKRAVGTYIPAVSPDGKRNPVIEAVLRGETYIGRLLWSTPGI